MKSTSVKEARQNRNEAKNEKERAEAVSAYREILHKAMIEADEEVKEILEKVKK